MKKVLLLLVAFVTCISLSAAPQARKKTGAKRTTTTTSKRTTTKSTSTAGKANGGKDIGDGATISYNKVSDKVTIKTKAGKSWDIKLESRRSPSDVQPKYIIQYGDSYSDDSYFTCKASKLYATGVEALTKICGSGLTETNIDKAANAMCGFMNVEGRPLTAEEKQASIKVKPTPVDMGLSVKWADIDLAAPSKTKAGEMTALEDTDMAGYLGDGWRVPTKKEMKELFDNCVAQLYLTSAGIPSKITLTSKKNGAKIDLYFGENAFWSNGQMLSNPARGSYMMAFACDDNVILMPVAAKLPASIKQPVANYVKAAKVKSMNFADWPDEMQKWLKDSADGIILDSTFSYGCKADFIDDVNKGTMKCQFRPVFDSSLSNDED